MAAKPMPGAAFGDYEILGELGAGGMGRVFRARHLTLQRDVALKVLGEQFATDESYRQRFVKEARAAAKLNHPNIVQIYDFGQVEGIFYLAMEFVLGESVGDRIRRNGKFSEADALATVRQACTALRVAHGAGIVHRDVKPDNLILSADGVVKLVDLGLAKSIADDQNMTQTGVVAGTPHYISPEQIAGLKDIDGRADIYSLGATLFHMVTGHTPFEGSSPMVIVAKHLHDEPVDPRTFAPTLSHGVCAVIRKMMARDRDERYPHMPAVHVDLLLLEAGNPPGALTPAPEGTLMQTAAMPSASTEPVRTNLDPALLASAEACLAVAIGPMARVLVRREAQKSSDFPALCTALSAHIPSDKDRRAFLAAATKEAAAAQQRSSLLLAHPATGSDSRLGSPTLGPDSSGAVTWDADALRAVEQRLADEIGPLAKVLVKRAARATTNWDALVASLASNLSGKQEAAFRSDVIKLAR
ncbi:MAG: serine/threonine protein kinase [Acidobacteriia bacterium]|nr:serine/threonine protein kinase [Terriglobia bacterium]